MKSRSFRELPLHLMILPGFVLVFIYSYIPMAGIIMAFERLVPSKGMFLSPWVGWANFEYMLRMPGIARVLGNTFFIAAMKMTAGIVVPVTFALLLNEAKNRLFKRGVQTIVYFPHFLSWIILSGILIDILSPSTGIVNGLLGWLGLPSVYFLGDPGWFPFTMAISDTWKEFGYGTIVYLAALAGINPALYEAAEMDGAGRIRQTVSVTLPGLLPIIVLMSVLSLGNVLNAGFDQIFNLYSPQVYETGDIIDTLVYRIGIENANYGVATAVGLFKSVVSFVMVGASYMLAYRLTGYRIF
ncbi:protein lplB [Cohnella sp. CIP 111063]|uniref:ABC transporter permease n=1 Tax=unclassified Cohnella TaxID=2636738 RepID=UPI000B8BFEEF|nr:MULTISPECIES: ABC transporter permease subunit [unclassified Cohnella]OXS55292.1 protein lplB [Cohnella sp. CIP 111063]PRX65719.1 putative aldouronate transport system permease protein [Cohnella sp. SGD-V74]